MKIFLCTGNKIYTTWVAKDLNIYQGGGCPDPILKDYKPYILESFYYADKDTERLIPYFADFMLDSGCFTFMQNATVRVDWKEYTYKYADFINRNNVSKFVEMDLDYIIGYDKVIPLRDLLEKETGKKAIPVWHPTRGKQEFLKMCDDYDYVALGGIVGQKWQGVEKYMPWFIKEAHIRKTKIHGLGFTKFEKLREYHFDSVDSTAWTCGNRFGFIYQYIGEGKLIKHQVPKGSRISDARKAAVINYQEWLKFQRWADVHL